jgi:HCOMODA/2-hydroxy-3-carboxy-muconic semialdehyde decarboxylase
MHRLFLLCINFTELRLLPSFGLMHDALPHEHGSRGGASALLFCINFTGLRLLPSFGLMHGRTLMTHADDAPGLESQLGDLVLANRILAREEVLDAFGHVSIRHPERPDRFFISRARGPALVERGDLIEFHLDGAPANPPLALPAYAERIIHGAIYQARPDVQAVCHHHATSVLPFCVTGLPLVPVFHLGATMGHHAPFWDARAGD